MLFNSIPFIGFILLFFAVKPLLWKNDLARWFWIFLMSMVFYAWWDWRFLFLLIGTGSIDYVCARFILRSANVWHRKFFLWFSVISNLLSLLIFKYGNWIIQLTEDLLELFVVDAVVTVPEFSFVLPVGISFYTFNSISYTIDIYKGKAQPARNWLHFMAFISFFPHLVAGPIIRARDVLQQLNKRNGADLISIYHGIRTCIWGFFQKMVLADNLAVYVNARFASPADTQDGLTWWFCMLAFSFQIYFDFNGYSTIARGLAKLCGIHFRLNFNHPYISRSFSEFWRRWHISLSSFFRDYVYIPLGGNRMGKARAELNRWITMLLSGLWHGANLTFLIWGALHAFFLSAEHFIFGKARLEFPLTVKLRQIGVFICVLLAWVFFRSPDLPTAFLILDAMFSVNGFHSAKYILMSNAIIWVLISVVLEFTGFRPLGMNWTDKPLMTLLINLMMLQMIVFMRGPEQDFIYFQF